MSEKEVVLQVTGVTKQFPGVLANSDVSLTLRKGEIVALLGENGAGKSTLMNIIYGLYHADSGTVKLRGQEVQFSNPREAIHSGIGMVHQHFQLIPVMTVADNVMLGEEITRGIFLDSKEAARRVRELSEQYNLAVDPDAFVEEIPVGTQQRVEIIKALYRDAEILILDEPTAVLTPQEVNDLFTIMRDLAERGVSIIFITHKLKEVLAVSHRIVVMRGGMVVGEATPEESTQESLAAMMVGREVLLQVHKGQAEPADVVLDVANLTAFDDRHHQTIKQVTFQVRAGEVLGVAGVQGNGQTELVEVLTGLRSAAAGEVKIGGEDRTNVRPREVTASGTGHVPEDRHRFGMVSSYTVAENLVLNTYYAPPFSAAPTMRTLPVAVVVFGVIAIAVFSILQMLWQTLWDAALWPLVLNVNGISDIDVASSETLKAPYLISLIVLLLITLIMGYIALVVAGRGLTWLRRGVLARLFDVGPKGRGLVLDHAIVDEHAMGLVKAFDIRTPGVTTSGGSLSGGNQQKLVVAREFGRKPRLLIAAQPTRGIDVGSIEFIHQQIVAQRDAGAAVLLVSAELDEITALSDRILVMYKGEVVATVEASQVTREQLGLLMAGASAADVLGQRAAVRAA